MTNVQKENALKLMRAGLRVISDQDFDAAMAAYFEIKLVFDSMNKVDGKPE